MPAAVFVVLVAVYCTLYGYWNMWNLGASFGHRGFVDVLPLGAPLFALTIDRLPRWPRRAVIVATAVCVYLTVNLMAGYWRGSLPCMGATSALYWRYATRGVVVGILTALAIHLALRAWRRRLPANPAVPVPQCTSTQAIREAA